MSGGFGVFDDDTSLGGGGGLFSPTQQGAPAQVLHSIFSPPTKKSTTSKPTQNGTTQQQQQQQRSQNDENVMQAQVSQPSIAVTQRSQPLQFVSGNHSVALSSANKPADQLRDVASVPFQNNGVRKPRQQPPPPPPPRRGHSLNQQAAVASINNSEIQSNARRPAPPPPPPRRINSSSTSNVSMNVGPAVAAAPRAAQQDKSATFASQQVVNQSLPSIPEGIQTDPAVSDKISAAATRSTSNAAANAGNSYIQATTTPHYQQSNSNCAASAQVVTTSASLPVSAMQMESIAMATASTSAAHPRTQPQSQQHQQTQMTNYSSPPKELEENDGNDIPRSLNIGSINPLSVAAVGTDAAATPSGSNIKRNFSSTDADANEDLFMSPISVLTEATKSIAVATGINYFGSDAAVNTSTEKVMPGMNKSAFQPVITTIAEGNPPTSQNYASSYHPPTSSSASVSASVVTYNDRIPIDMLDFDYVSRATSVKELEQIVAVLDEESPPKYPSLLRIARKRLSKVLEQDAKTKLLQKNAEKEQSFQQHQEIILTTAPIQSSVIEAVAPAATAVSASLPSEAAMDAPLQTATTGESVPTAASTSLPAYQQIAPPVISTGKRVNFAAPMSARSLDTPRSELLGFSIVDHDADSLVMDLSPSTNGGSIRSRLSRTSSVRMSTSHISANQSAIMEVLPSTEEVASAAMGSSSEGHNQHQRHNDDSETDATDEELKVNLACVLAEQSMLKNEIDAVVRERDSLKVRLASQTVELRALEGEIAMQQANFDAKTQSLQEEKARVETERDALKSTTVDSSIEAREIMTQLKTREREILALQEEIRLVKEKRRRDIDKLSEFQEELLAEIEHLNDKLQRQKLRSDEALRSLEERLNEEFEVVIVEQQAKIDSLSEQFSASQNEVVRLSSQKEDLSRALKAVRSNAAQKALRRIDNKEELEEATASAQAAEAAASAMAKALAASENELLEATERKNEFERQCTKLRRENSLLIEENRRLAARIQSLTKGLAENHAYIDTLQEQVTSIETDRNENSEAMDELRDRMYAMEKSYKSELGNLQTELETKKSWVPATLYQKAVKDLRKREDEVTKLSSKLTKLSTKRSSTRREARNDGIPLTISIEPNSKVACKKKRSSGEKKEKAPRQISPNSVNSEDQKENKTVSNRPSSSEKQEVYIPAAVKGKSLARMKALRAAGGKRGLQEKLRRVRGDAAFKSPPQ